LYGMSICVRGVGRCVGLFGGRPGCRGGGAAVRPVPVPFRVQSSPPPPAPPPAAAPPPPVVDPSPPAAPPPATTTAPAPTIQPVSAADLGPSWHPGCPIDPRQLRRVEVNYIGFDGQTRRGDLMVHQDCTPD